jgi:hypothetical protein
MNLLLIPTSVLNKLHAICLIDVSDDGLGLQNISFLFFSSLSLASKDDEARGIVMPLTIVGPGYQPGCIILRVGNLAD